MDKSLTGPLFGASRTFLGNTAQGLNEKVTSYAHLCKCLKSGEISQATFNADFKRLGLADIFYVHGSKKSIPW